MLVAQHNFDMLVKDGGAVRNVPACLSVFKIGGDGKLEYVRKYRCRCRQQPNVLDGNGSGCCLRPLADA